MWAREGGRGLPLCLQLKHESCIRREEVKEDSWIDKRNLDKNKRKRILRRRGKRGRE